MKKGLTPNQLYLLYCKKNNTRHDLLVNIAADLKLLVSSGFLNSEYELTDKGEEALSDFDGVFKKTKITGGTDLLGSNYLNEIKIYRDKFPTGKKSTPAEVLEKFIKLFLKQPGLSWNIIHQATDLYFSEDRDEKYIMKAANFVMVDRGGSTVYTLSEYCERIDSGEQAGSSNEVSMYRII